jgi:hypothetical protein
MRRYDAQIGWHSITTFHFDNIACNDLFGS